MQQWPGTGMYGWTELTCFLVDVVSSGSVVFELIYLNLGID